MLTVTTMAETVVSPIKCNEIIIILQFLFLGKYYCQLFYLQGSELVQIDTTVKLGNKKLFGRCTIVH